jgi:hypothetical protein
LRGLLGEKLVVDLGAPMLVTKPPQLDSLWEPVVCISHVKPEWRYGKSEGRNLTRNSISSREKLPLPLQLAQPQR